MRPKGAVHLAGWPTGRRGGNDEDGPWAGRVLGALLLVLALVAIYHGTAGRSAWRDLATFLAGQAPMTTPAARMTGTDLVPPLAGEPQALGDLGASVAEFVGMTHATDWAGARRTLSAMNTAWMRLAAELAAAGVPTLELNTFTTLLSDAQGRVAARDLAGARTDANLLQSELGVLTVSWVGSEAPTYLELKELVRDLQPAVRMRNWQRASADASDLGMLVARIGQGF